METATDRALTDGAPQAWVGCLGCYNAGALVGRWVDGEDAADVTVSELHARQPEAHEADPYASLHEELWVMDFQGYEGALTGECSPDEATRIATALALVEDSPYPLAAVVAYRDNLGPAYAPWATWDEWESDFSDAYAGEWDSLAAFAEDFAEETGQAPSDGGQWPTSYIDWQAAASELEVWEHDAGGGRVYVFWQR